MNKTKADKKKRIAKRNYEIMQEIEAMKNDPNSTIDINFVDYGKDVMVEIQQWFETKNGKKKPGKKLVVTRNDFFNYLGAVVRENAEEEEEMDQIDLDEVPRFVLISRRGSYGGADCLDPIFESIPDLMDFEGLEEIALERIQGYEEIEVFINGMAHIAVALINACIRNKTKLTLFTYDRTIDGYLPQRVHTC